jgi:hypothetical protein
VAGVLKKIEEAEAEVEVTLRSVYVQFFFALPRKDPKP